MLNSPGPIAAAFRAATYAQLRPRRGAIDPILIPANDAFEALGIRRTFGMKLIADGHLAARRIAGRLMVETASLNEFVSGLPVAGRADPRHTLNRARREFLGVVMRFAVSGADQKEVTAEIEATISAMRQLIEVSQIEQATP